MTALLRLLIPAALLLAAPLAAHQQKEAITRVLFNPRTGNIEIMHRFLVHDAEHAVRELHGGAADLLASSADRENFAAYVHERFVLRDGSGALLPLSPIGHELDGRFLWVYAETPIPPGLEALTLEHQALRDLWPEQVNLVNVEQGENIRSATFTRGVTELTIEL